MLTLKVHSLGTDKCSLTGKETDGLKVAFEGEEPRFLSHRAFRQLLAFRMPAKVEAKPTVPMTGSK